MARQSKSRARRKTSAWFHRHVHDLHVRRAQAEGKRSRAVFKLTEILRKYKLLEKKANVIIDLGCAPGSWSTELAPYAGEGGLVIGVDTLGMQPVGGVHVIRGDFTGSDTLARMEAVLAGRRVDLVVSDMAPEMSGHKLVDQARMMGLNEATLDFAVNHLRPGGHLLLKTFMGGGFDSFRRDMAGWFEDVKIVKPAASRKSSSEIYLLGKGFRIGGRMPTSASCPGGG